MGSYEFLWVPMGSYGAYQGMLWGTGILTKLDFGSVTKNCVRFLDSGGIGHSARRHYRPPQGLAKKTLNPKP